MNLHPLLSMAGVWLSCVLAFWILPYQLLERPATFHGMTAMAGYLAAFAIGTLLVPRQRRVASSNAPLVDARVTERLLGAVSIAAGLAFALDGWGSDLLDLVVAYELRSEAANALLQGDVSGSSAWFQIGFLLYPACYVYIATHVLYAPRVQPALVALVGLLPIVLATLVMGGRMPILYAVVLIGLVWRERRKTAHARDTARARQSRPIRRAAVALSVGLLLLLLVAYFVAVFVVRAEAVGGVGEMFDRAETLWGVGFRGSLYLAMLSVLGETGTYLAFVFIWYLVQGLVMGNHLLAVYDGPLQWGVYGVDIVSAIARRIAPEQLAQGFDALLTLGTYGFFPSAWGSLYVDFGYAGLLGALLWGVFAGLTWHRIVRQHRQDWMLVGPFVTVGIVFSVINTPLGFTNGFITHLWLLGAFLMLRRSPAGAADPSNSSARDEPAVEQT